MRASCGVCRVRSCVKIRETGTMSLPRKYAVSRNPPGIARPPHVRLAYTFS